MFVQASRITSLLSRASKSDSFKANQGVIYTATTRTMATNDIGSGAGKGGGAGGSIREAGGAMGKKGAAQEEQFFSKQNKDLKEKLKVHLKDEIKKHEEAIKANKDLLKDM